MCHGAVSFLLARDPEGRAFRFAPIGGEAFVREVDTTREVPDSVCVSTREGQLLTRSSAMLHLLRKLSLGYRLLAAGLSLVPRRWLDVAYDWVARNRHRWYAKPEDACPVVPPPLRERFHP